MRTFWVEIQLASEGLEMPDALNFYLGRDVRVYLI